MSERIWRLWRLKNVQKDLLLEILPCWSAPVFHVPPVIKALCVSPNVRSRRRSLPSAAQVTPGAPKVDQNAFLKSVRKLSIEIAQLS